MHKTFIVIGVCAAIAALCWFAPGVLDLPFDLVDLALGWAGRLTVVVVVSALVGVLFILAFPHVSAQNGIRAVKDRIKYNLLAIRIYQDSLPTVLKSTGGTLGWNVAYLGLNVLPMVFLFAPFMAVWFQLNSLYAFQPLKPGDERVVVCELNDGVEPGEVELVTPDVAADGSAWSVVEGPVRVAGGPGERYFNFTLRAERPGSYEIMLRHRGETVAKALEIATEPQRLTKIRTAAPLSAFAHMKDPIVFFGEGILPEDSFVRSIFIDYPPAPLGPFGGGEVTIMLVFLVVSLAVGFGLKGMFGVEI